LPPNVRFNAPTRGFPERIFRRRSFLDFLNHYIFWWIRVMKSGLAGQRSFREALAGGLM